MNKLAFLLLILIMAMSSLALVEPVNAFPKPSVPEFTVEVIDSSYDVPPVYSTDPYTGKTTMTREGYRALNGTIELAIKNQPFTSYKGSNGSTIDLYYRIRSKGHFSDNWYYYPNFDYGNPSYMESSDSDFTIHSISYGENYWYTDISAGGQLDFQVEAFVGYHTTYIETDPIFHRPYSYWVFTGETSGWSETQTVTVDELDIWAETSVFLEISVAVLVIAVLFGLLIYFNKRRRGGSKHA
jgi:hypothetical protein